VTTNSLDTTGTEADAKNLEDVGKIRTARRVENEALTKVPEKKGERNVEDEGDEESQPPADVLFTVSGCDSHKSSDVNQKVEPEHSTLSGSFGVNDDLLALLGSGDDGDSFGHLIEKKRRNIRLEDTCKAR
jgi:hypothetical protein